MGDLASFSIFIAWDQILWQLEVGSDANLALSLTFVATKLTQNDVARNVL
jgi:hypothetical protein